MIVILTLVGNVFPKKREWAIRDGKKPMIVFGKKLAVSHRIDGPNSTEMNTQWFKINGQYHRLSGHCGSIIDPFAIFNLVLDIKPIFSLEENPDKVTEEEHLENIKERYK